MKKPVQTLIEKERQRRICVAIWAYAYEFLSASIVSDAKFDKTCQEIDVKIATGHKVMDKWFKKEFSPHTGQWVRNHPYLEVLRVRAIALCCALDIIYVDLGVFHD